MSAGQALSAGFSDPVHASQVAFRSALQALSRPGTQVELGARVQGVNLGGAMAHLLLTLTDEDTPVWWQQADPATSTWLRFHTGAPQATTSQAAAFAVLTQAFGLGALDDFALGSASAPEFSCTLLVEVPSLDQGAAVQWRGPGLREAQTVRVAGLPPGFWSQWQANHNLFPQGVDIIFCCGSAALGLPRTTLVQPVEGG